MAETSRSSEYTLEVILLAVDEGFRRVDATDLGVDEDFVDSSVNKVNDARVHLSDLFCCRHGWRVLRPIRSLPWR